MLIPLSRIDAAMELHRIDPNIMMPLRKTMENSNPHLFMLNLSLQLQLPSAFSWCDKLLCFLRLEVAFTNSYYFLYGMADSPIGDH